MAADADVDIQPDVAVDHAEGNGVGCAVFVAQNLLGVEEINALILARIPAEGNALADGLEGVEQPLAESAVKNARLGGRIIDEFARFRAQLDHLSLIDDNHALPFVDGNHRAVGQDIVLALGIGTALVAGALFAFGHKHVFRHSVTIDIFAPLVCQRPAERADGGFDKSHFSFYPPLSVVSAAANAKFVF